MGTVMKLEELDTTKRFRATVTDTKRITPETAAEVRHIVLNIPNTELNYEIGESIGVVAPGPHAFGNEEHLPLSSVR